MPALYVTNFNPRFTGVSATTAAVLSQQQRGLDAVLVGHALPGCPAPLSLHQALRLSRHAPAGLPFALWHVRRNSEMQAALFARDVLRLPIRIVFTSAAQRRHSPWPRWLISRMDAVIATTDAAAGFVPHVRATVPHGVDTDRFTPAADRAAAWATTGFPGAYGIVTVGRIRPEKGTDRFVAAMIRALPQLPGATAVIIGMAKPADRAFVKALEAQIAQAGLADRILFAGEVPAPQMPALLQGAGLLMALPRYEGYGLTPLEAMAAGVPVVATDTGHFAEFVGNDAGLIVAQDRPTGQAGAGTATLSERAAVAAVSVLSDPVRHAATATAARRRATGLFSLHTETAGIRAVYDRVWTSGNA